MMTGEWLRSVRKSAGLSAEDAYYELRGLLPRSLVPSSATLRRLELRDDFDPVVAAVLAVAVYGKRPEELPASLMAEVERVHELLGRIRGTASVTLG